jgi:UDP-N-acetylmuramoyl-tripeptide--D-alanyl-D-alanine ligase
MRSMSLAQIARMINCEGDFPATLVKGYCTDSRLLKEGELFFALKGERVDGHNYLPEIQKKGASAAVVAKNYQGHSEGLNTLIVEDPLHCLQELARKTLIERPTRVVAITGSIGKTSTKEFTKTLLGAKYRIAASPGNHNSQVGVPLAILNHTNGEEEILVLEMGLSAPGQLTRLIQIAPPEVSVITTVALVHACNFDSIEDIAWAKAEIFSHPQTRLGILHRDIPNFIDICRVGTCPKLSFSTTSSQADYFMDSSHPTILKILWEKNAVHLGPITIPGKHNVQNLLSALAVAKYFNISWEEMNQSIPSLILPERRLQFVKHHDIVFLNDSYNASELSVKSALETLPEPEREGRKIAVLGSMLELGKFSQDCHKRVGEFALKHVEQLYCLGDECLPIYEIWKKAGRLIYFFKNRADLVDCLRQDLRPADVVLLKGSRAKELWKVLDEL